MAWKICGVMPKLNFIKAPKKSPSQNRKDTRLVLGPFNNYKLMIVSLI
jgi:hypothetical protein